MGIPMELAVDSIDELVKPCADRVTKRGERTGDCYRYQGSSDGIFGKLKSRIIEKKLFHLLFLQDPLS